jgi:hypothetical protein
VKRTPLTRKTPLKRTAIKKKATKKPVPSVAVLDRLFSEYVRLRAGNDCQLFGFTGKPCSSQLQCSHIFSRIYHSVRWDPTNAIACCACCHREQHRRPLENAQWLSEVVGPEELQSLRDRWQSGKKPTPEEKRAIKAWLSEKLGELR